MDAPGGRQGRGVDRLEGEVKDLLVAFVALVVIAILTWYAVVWLDTHLACNGLVSPGC